MAVSGWFSSCATRRPSRPWSSAGWSTWARSACVRGLLLGAAARRDVGGDHHLRQPAVGPLQVARAHVEPFPQRRDEDLGVFGARLRSGCLVGRPARLSTSSRLVVGEGCAGMPACVDQLQVAAGLGAEPQPVRAVGEQQFARCPAAPPTPTRPAPSSTVVKRSCEADSWSRMRLGSVMLVIEVIQPVCWPLRVDQRRDVHARVEQRAVLALDPHLDAAGRAAAAAVPAAAARPSCSWSVLGPVGEGRGAADQLGFGQAGHLAERRVDVGDAALQVHRAHAGEHGVFHRAAEVGFRHQRAAGSACAGACGASCRSASRPSCTLSAQTSQNRPLPITPSEVR